MKKALSILSVLFASGCTVAPSYVPSYVPSETIKHRLGDFNVASSFNVQNLDYDAAGDYFTSGEHCISIVAPKTREILVKDEAGEFVKKVETIGRKEQEGRLKIAMDNAIRNGRSKGIKGDVLVNVRIDKLIKDGGKNKPKLDCYHVEGDLVSIRSK